MVKRELPPAPTTTPPFIPASVIIFSAFLPVATDELSMLRPTPPPVHKILPNVDSRTSLLSFFFQAGSFPLAYKRVISGIISFPQHPPTAAPFTVNFLSLNSSSKELLKLAVSSSFPPLVSQTHSSQVCILTTPSKLLLLTSLITFILPFRGQFSGPILPKPLFFFFY